jgi:3-oxoacyl-[acyl-carrier protein] reductase
MDLQLSNAVVVVTGGSAGIGRATALELAREGATVVVGARSKESLDSLAQELAAIGGAHLTVPGDLTTVEGVTALVEAARSHGGRIDGLLAAVGSTPVGDFDEVDDEIWQRSFNGKFLASVRAVRAVLPDMRAHGTGRIVVVAGNTAHGPGSWMATSGAMNAALVNLVASTAQHVARDGVGINCLSPGPTDTARYQGMRATVMRRERLDEQAAGERIRSGIPAGRVADPAEVARVATVLLSLTTAHVNGTNVVVDGAQTSLS